MTTRTLATPSLALASAREQFGDARGYLAVASIGLPPRSAVEALKRDLDAWFAADRDPQGYDPIIERTRAHYAALVGVAPSRVAAGSQTSVITSLIAAAVPEGTEVLCVEGDFSSIIFPFLERPGIRVRTVPLDRLAESIDERTWLVSFSLVQSSTGVVADVPAILEAAGRVGALSYCDTTQATGVHPVDASLFDATVCHSYKWLCSPRGVAFLTVSEAMQRRLTPLQAGWYAGEEVWKSCYGPEMHLARDARRFDVSPAWQAWVGAEQAIGLFAGLDIAEVWEWTAGLGDQLCEALGIRPQHQAIVTWADAEGDDLRALAAAGIRASGRAGRLRASFHLWNDTGDVERVLAAVPRRERR
ncbi:aminotransferase class V-fold PLP-dependent enzyme [Galbitalea soli]|uniref:Aminotransferase class V-fold PLP-dependent enzyme n=1 Tax=Galbitalea soli TaxID=1268042 RepID=A0A7C9TP71_9MICO|nr:aminotransferase class V-fold PLP-dependent enzyme [Galbitalea soli]NEM89862.1 aminotransferase class V-fold PLP-dependent enzyme [Galbitalea soli]NYJ30566.1 selenocysteine lyase/cysteine desulfurase [Galbitalea soli]